MPSGVPTSFHRPPVAHSYRRAAGAVPVDMTPASGHGGCFAKRPSETRHLGRAGRPPESGRRPAAMLMISAPMAGGNGSSEDCSGGSVAARCVAPDDRAGCASLCQRGCFAADRWLGSRFAEEWRGVRRRRIARGQDLGGLKPRQQSELSQRNDSLGTDPGLQQLPHSGSRARNP